MVIVNKTSDIRQKKKIPYLNNLLREIEDKLHLERIQMENRWCFFSYCIVRLDVQTTYTHTHTHTFYMYEFLGFFFYFY